MEIVRHKKRSNGYLMNVESFSNMRIRSQREKRTIVAKRRISHQSSSKLCIKRIEKRMHDTDGDDNSFLSFNLALTVVLEAYGTVTDGRKKVVIRQMFLKKMTSNAYTHTHTPTPDRSTNQPSNQPFNIIQTDSVFHWLHSKCKIANLQIE